MTAALVQKCNKCSKPFVKLSGCNKMTCNCGNLQCYVCGQNVKDYRHFEQTRKDGTKCPLHENNDSRLEAKILNAREEAVKKVLEDEEGLDEEDVKVDAPVITPGNGLPIGFGGGGFLADMAARGGVFLANVQANFAVPADVMQMQQMQQMQQVQQVQQIQQMMQMQHMQRVAHQMPQLAQV
jgi:hypothetical protein